MVAYRCRGKWGDMKVPLCEEMSGGMGKVINGGIG